jgi:flavin-dependent dehydrogenase
LRVSAKPPDVAIVGAGPAGAFAAFLLARRGARVTLFDPSHPREKPCGGGVTGRALALVSAALGAAPLAGASPSDVVTSGLPLSGVPLSGVALSDVPRSSAPPSNVSPSNVPLSGVPIASARFEDAADRTAAVSLHAHGFTPDSSLIVVSRAAFDRALLDGAIAAGATFAPARVTAVETSTRGATVHTSQGAWHGDFILGADGANSFVRRRLGRAFERRQLSIATGFYAQNVSSDEIVIRFVPEPQGYIWSFPRANHLAIGICAQADEAQPGPLREIVADWIKRSRIADGARLEPYSWPIPSLGEADFDRDEPSRDRWMLLGDAAGLVDPITREGIFFALRSAEMAVESLTLTGRDPSRAYRARLADEIYPELRHAARLKRQFFRGPFTRLLVDALTRSEAVRAIMRDLVAGQQPYGQLKRRLIGTFEVGLAWQLLRLELTRA